MSPHDTTSGGGGARLHPPRGVIEHTFAAPLPPRQHDAHEQQQRQQQQPQAGAWRVWSTVDGASGSGSARAAPAALLPPRPASAYMPLYVQRVWHAFHDVRHGFAVRLLTACVVTCVAGYVVYKAVFVRAQQSLPLAQRMPWLSPLVPVTLLSKERVDVPGDELYVFRFALPNSYDTAGYAPVSSVQLISGTSRWRWMVDETAVRRCRRWYTPTSHPDTRGHIEFVIRLHRPGTMSRRLRELAPGDVMHLGRWRRDFDYTRNTHGEVGLICSTAGASVALQLLRIVARDHGDQTRLRLLYCTAHRHHVPFRASDFDALAHAQPSRFRVAYNVLSRSSSSAATAAATTTAAEAGDADERVHVGLLGEDTIEATMPPPQLRVPASSLHGHEGSSNSSSTAEAQQQQQQQQQQSQRDAEMMVTVRPPILVCGPRQMTAYLCGTPMVLLNYTYWQGPWFYYRGILKDMGYTRAQVYKFGLTRWYLTSV